MITKEEEFKYYDNVYRDSTMYSCYPDVSQYFPVWDKIVSILDKKERIYEIGCGSGQLAHLLFNAGINYKKGFDYLPVAIEMAKKLNPKHEDKFYIADVYKQKPFRKADTIICTEVLEHLDDDLHVLSLLPKGIRFIFSVPNYRAKTHKRVFNTLDEIINRYSGLRINEYYKFVRKNAKIIHLIDSTKI